MNFSISGFFISVPILVFIGFWMHIPSTILHMLKKRSKKRLTISFYRCPQSSRTEFSNKLIASNFLML